MTTKTMIEVMQAYERGEQIERRKSKECKWEIVIHPTWDWSRITYRVKPQPTLRPYKDAEEFLQAQKEHGMYLQEKVSKCVAIPLLANDYSVMLPCCAYQYLTSQEYIYENLLADFVWQDGTPCGVEEWA